MSDFPKSVEFHEEGAREGFQMEPITYPRERRVALLNALSATGLRQIQVGSLVNPRKVPQMADTLELFAEIERRPSSGCWGGTGCAPGGGGVRGRTSSPTSVKKLSHSWPTKDFTK